MQLAKGEIAEIWGRKKLKNLFQPIDIATLVLFRIMFGGIMLWEVTRYFRYGWIERYWIEPAFNFSYAPFNFQPLPGNGMYIVWAAMGVLALFILLGLFYRVSASLFFCLFTYSYLLEQARYLNHFYLVVLISFLMIFLPANRALSIDSLLFKKIRTDVVPAWSLWLVRFIIGVPYFFGGIAKINHDWLRGYPLKNWLLGDLDFPIIGPYFTEHWMVMIMSYSGLILDLAVVPVLLFRKTRAWGFAIITLFHLMNDQLFTIGIFPWFMMAATTLFFPPDWPRKLFRWDRKVLQYQPATSAKQKIVLYGLAAFCALQVLLPFRHLLIPGNVHWTEGGHRYAWHMKLRGKAGSTVFYVKNKANGESVEVNMRGYIERWQESKMAGKPYMIWEFAQHLKKEHALMGLDVGVYVSAYASLNGRQYQELIDPNVDLAAVPRPTWGHASWIRPLTTPLEDQR